MMTASAPSSVIVTLVTSDDFVIGAQVLAFSLAKVRSQLPLYCLVLSSLSKEAKALLSKQYHLIECEPIPNPHADVHVQQWLDVGFTKLRLWEQVQFEQILYIDADCVVVRNVDHIFHHKRKVAFAAAPDVFPPGDVSLVLSFQFDVNTQPS